MERSPFTHLHVHSDYSLLDGAVKVKEHVRLAKEDGMHSIGLTDHGNMFGAIEFYKAARKAGLNPIIGMEAYIAPRSRHERKSTPGEPKNFHLTLLSTNLTGFHNLIRLSSQAYTEGFYYRPRIDRELLRENAEGLIALSGCLNGEVCWNLRRRSLDDAVRVAEEYREMLGKGNYYVELMRHGLEDQQAVEPGLLEVAKKTGLPLIATNDIHYRTREDHHAHEVLLCLSTGKVLNDENRMRLYTDEFYFKSSREMGKIFEDLPEAYDSTAEIAARCDIQLPMGEHHLPRFEPEDGRTPEELFRELCEAGFRKRYPSPPEGARERLEHEMEVIEKLNFTSYFLIVADFIRHAREKGIPVGPGRGSAAGSIVAYVMEITDIEPLRFGLIFERFLNADRISLPDIDVDFCKRGRGSVIEYLRNKYGESNVTQIITFGSLAARGVIRDVGRVLGVPLKDVDRIAKMIPETLGTTLTGTLEKEPDVAELYEADEQVKELFDTALRLEGLNRHASTHAAGVVISDRPLVDHVPLYKNGDDFSTQYAMESVEDIGLLKVDVLGLKTLTIIDEALAALRESQGVEIDLRTLPEDDRATYELLQSGRTSGIFQLESQGMRDLLVKLRPDSFEDIIALIALYRPGPLQSGMVTSYIHRKHGQEEVTYQHPLLQPILESTNGVILYQEQVMRIAHDLAGFSLNEADSLRKAMGKKKPEIMKRFKKGFVEGCLKKDIPKKLSSQIFDLMEKFAGYGFNKSHSTAYAVLAYQTAYLKANYPTEFLSALLTCSSENSDKVVEYLDACKRLGIEVLPPDVNESEHSFRVRDGKIRYGLAAVKGVGQKAVESMVAARERLGRFASVHDFVEHVDLRLCNKSVIEALARCGAFDGLGVRRAQVLAASESLISQGQGIQQERASGQMNMFGDMVAPASSLPDVPELKTSEKLAFEKQTLGFYLTGHPLESVAEELKARAMPIERIREMAAGDEVTCGGLITAVRRINDRRGNPMAFITIEDLHGTMDITAFKDAYARYKSVLQPEQVIIARGKVNRAREEPTVLLDTATTWENAPPLQVEISVPLDEATPERMARIRDAICAEPGPCPVQVDILPPEGGRPVTVAARGMLKTKVDSARLTALRAVVGGGSVEVTTPGPFGK